jgi:hypothetical protein
MAAVACLLMAAPGCQYNRTGRGFTVRSQWALEYGDTEGTPVQVAGKPSDSIPVVAVQPAEPAQAKPELLPWRARLKNRYLAARVRNQTEPDGVKSSDRIAALLAADARRKEMTSLAASAQPASFGNSELQAKSVKPATRQIISTASVPRDSKRPDLVIE